MRRLLPLACGALGSALVVSLTKESSGLAMTLAMLPLAAGLFELVRRELRAPPASSEERVLWIGWLALALDGRRLGLPLFEPLTATALVLLLAWRVSRLLPSLRRRMGGRKPGGASWPFAALPLALGLALLPWIHAVHEPNGDEPYFLLLAESLVSDFDFDLADEYRENAAREFTTRKVEPQPGDWRGADGVQRSRHESLLVFYLAPFWLVGGAFGARFGMLLIWALLAERLLALVRAAGAPPRGALRAWTVAIFAAPVAVYAAQIWVETAAALAVAVALERWLGARQRASSQEWKHELALAAALLALPLLKLRLLAIALPFALLRILERRRRHLDGLALFALVIGAALVLWRNDRLVGRALGIYLPTDFLPVALGPRAAVLGFDGLLFDLAFGLFAAGPIWLVSLGGLRGLAARRSVVGRALLASLPYFLVVVSLRSWYGGWSPAFRYGVVLLPVVAVALGFAFARTPTRAQRLLFGALGFVSAILALAFTVEPGWATSFADGRGRIVDLAAAPFAADLARLLPSALRPRLATWLAPVVVLATLWLASRDHRRFLRAQPLAATAALLAMFVAAVIAAHRLPTRVAEAEDPWVSRGVGQLYPDLWAVDRTKETGGLSLTPTDTALEIAPIAAGKRVSIRIAYRAHPSNRWAAVLIVSSSKEHELTRFRIAPRTGWVVKELPEREWSPEERLQLKIAVASTDPGRAAVALVIDRAEFDWR